MMPNTNTAATRNTPRPAKSFFRFAANADKDIWGGLLTLKCLNYVKKKIDKECIRTILQKARTFFKPNYGPIQVSQVSSDADYDQITATFVLFYPVSV
jgi:hypothetical protein